MINNSCSNEVPENIISECSNMPYMFPREWKMTITPEIIRRYCGEGIGTHEVFINSDNERQVVGIKYKAKDRTDNVEYIYTEIPYSELPLTQV